MYPRDAYAARQEGMVTLGFDIAPTGETANVHVLSSTLPKVFDAASIESLQGWEYTPPASGLPITNQTATIRYTLKDAELRPIPVRPFKIIYPEAARNTYAQGYCRVQFWIEPDGTTSDAHILSCAPSGLFEQATLVAAAAATYRQEADPVVNRRRAHSASVRFVIPGVQTQSYIKPGQWISLRYTLKPDGRAKDVEVLAQSDPSAPRFHAIRQLKNTTFAPVLKNGQPVEVPDQRMIISGDVIQ